MEPRTIDLAPESVASDVLGTGGYPQTAVSVSVTDTIATHSVMEPSNSVAGHVSQLVQFLNMTPVWELALVIAAVLIICVLVGARLIEAVSNRDLDFSPMMALSAGSDDDANEADASDGGPSHTYEAYISPDTPDELLSDRGQIIRILVENDGRTYQYRIVEETGWSKSKVSRLLSEMHDRGEIGKVSVGRENAIVLADHGPDGGDGIEDDQSVTVGKSPS